MSEGQVAVNQIIEEPKENMEIENRNTSPNHQNNDIKNNLNSNNVEQKEELKLGQYILTPLQSILINKLMPLGYKLETEENILKSLEIPKNQGKKYKQSRNKDNSGKSNNRNAVGQKKRNQGLNNLDNIPPNISQEIYKIYKKCKNGLDKIKESKYALHYYQSRDPEVPCLANLEKKVNNYEYKNLYDFQMDGRKIWYHYFDLDPNDERTKKMSEDWEKICTDLESQNIEMSVNSIKKRTDKIQKDLTEYKEYGGITKENLPAPIKKINQQNSEHNKPMTVEEKNQLGNNIRTLNKEQLKGIIKILNENNSVPKSKYFEFDIDKLPNKKLRELERYVKECLIVNNRNLSSLSANPKNLNQKENQNNKNPANNKTNSNQTHNQNSASKNNNKETNKTNEARQEPSSLKKNKSGKKSNNNRNESFSDSESISSDSSLSN